MTREEARAAVEAHKRDIAEGRVLAHYAVWDASIVEWLHATSEQADEAHEARRPWMHWTSVPSLNVADVRAA